MAAFQSVNTVLTPGPFLKQEETPSTATQDNAGPSAAGPSTSKIDEAKTPTKASFASLPSQKDTKAGEASSSATTSEFKKAAKRESSQYSTKSRDSEDVDMEDSDGDDDGSDEDSVAADGSRSTKKKKSQRFFCTDYAPCNLSFTRSEHLARHIRFVKLFSILATCWRIPSLICCIGNTRGNGHFSVTAHVASRGWITYGSMPRPST